MTESKYTPTIGLEIHAELKTRTKMFCGSKNDSDETRPNVNVCPICMGHPGTLPAINKEAVKSVLKFGVAVRARLADFTEFDRKNYFYPDIPKGYQISQYKYPLVSGGELAGIKLTRVHLEEDTGTSTHDKGNYTLIDFNRAGVPLMELVTEPVIHSAKEAGNFGRELQRLLRCLKIADANMEKGELRIEVNISLGENNQTNSDDSISKKEPKKLGTKVEVKNLNSFKAVEKAVDYEIKRQTEVLEQGGEVLQETRGWNDTSEKTVSQRSKEEAHDYRYFPEPDLPKIYISEIPEFSEEGLKAQLPELPNEKRLRYKAQHAIKDSDIEFFIDETDFGKLFEDVAEILSDKTKLQLAANYIISDLAGLVKSGTDENMKDTPALWKFTAKEFAELVQMIAEGKISSRGAKDVLAVMRKEGGEPCDIAEEKGLLQQNDENAVRKIAQEVLTENAKVAEEYKNGKSASLQYLIGQGMKKSKGSANPEMLKKMFLEICGSA